ncbi:MAG: I78 family peptidase inhibitor [Thermomonas sp.]
MKRLLLLSALLATSTACTPMPPKAKATTPFPPRLAQCQADPGQGFVGQVASEDVVEQAKTATGANSVRVLKPGMAATMDFRDDRLNLMLDEHDMIVKVSCG